jgi:hypothetical protein
VNGRIYLFAHFEPTTNPVAADPESQIWQLSNANPLPNGRDTLEMRNSRKRTLSVSSQGHLEEGRGPETSTTTQPRKCSRRQNLSPSPEYLGSVENYAEPTEVPDDARGPAGSALSPSAPPQDKYENYKAQLKKYEEINFAPGQWGYHDNWENLSKGTRKKISHARCIQGEFGQPAPAPCTGCRGVKGKTCRVYSPVYNDRMLRCGECALAGKPCTFDENGQRERHQRPVQRRNQTDGPAYCCPVQSCPRRTLKSFPTFEEVEEHILSAHPSTNHALVIQARPGEKIKLHPLPLEEYQRARSNYLVENASEGEFGHRSDWVTGLEEGVITRLRDARLAHTFGILAKKPCGHCRTRGLTCIVRHPEACTSQSPQPYCSNCKFGSRTCPLSKEVLDYFPNKKQTPGGSRTRKFSGSESSFGESQAVRPSRKSMEGGFSSQHDPLRTPKEVSTTETAARLLQRFQPAKPAETVAARVRSQFSPDSVVD